MVSMTADEIPEASSPVVSRFMILEAKVLASSTLPSSRALTTGLMSWPMEVSEKEPLRRIMAMMAYAIANVYVARRAARMSPQTTH